MMHGRFATRGLDYLAARKTRLLSHSASILSLPGSNPRHRLLRVKKHTCHLLLMLVTALPALGQITNSDDVTRILAQALARASHFVANGMSTNPVVAVVDREGFVLGVRSLLPEPNDFDV